MEVRKIKRNKPRVAVLITTWFPVHTGQQVYTARLARALTEEGYEVDILTRNIQGRIGTEAKAFEKIPALRIKKFGFPSHPWNLLMQVAYMVWAFFYLLLKGKSYRLYHAHSASSAAVMKAASWFTRVPTLVTVHTNHVFEKSWTLKKILHRVMFLETKYTQEVSIAENFLKATNVNEGIHIVPYGIDPTPFDALPVQRHPEQFNVLFVGRMDHQKGIDILLKAAKKVVDSNDFIQSHKDFMLHLAGEGPDKKSFQALVQKLGLGKYVRFYGLVTGEDLIRLYKSCDLFVLPSRIEALPLSVLEAACARLPVLATHTGDLRQVVLENVNGHLVEPEDVDELAYYLEYYAGNPHLEALGEGSYQVATQEYAWEKTVEKMLRIYETLLTHKEVKASRSHEHLPFWKIPLLFWHARGNQKQYRGKAGLSFCLTVNVYGDDMPFLQRFTEFCAQLEIPSTIFFQSDRLKDQATAIRALQAGEHEIGVQTSEIEWVTSPMRRSTLRDVQSVLQELGLENITMIQPPFIPSEQDIEIIHEAGFETLPTSEDPWPTVEFHYGIPFGHRYAMNLKSLLEWTDEEFLEAVNRLRAYEKKLGLPLFLIFECDSDEFVSQEESDYASGENFTFLSKKLTFLKNALPVQFLTLSALCKSGKVEKE